MSAPEITAAMIGAARTEVQAWLWGHCEEAIVFPPEAAAAVLTEAMKHIGIDYPEEAGG